MLEAFVDGRDKRFVGHIALLGLGAILVALFFVDRTPGTTAFWQFYTADSLAMTYKGIALLTTILVLILGLDYIPVLEKFTARVGGKGTWGEFFCLPVFICAGMMWMASATDLTSIFVSLELVTIAFYVMVTFMRRNVGSLEAGVKYLILGALSTGFIVYGFTWLYGITGQTNLTAIAAKLDSGARGSTTTFSKQSTGDVLITWENEAYHLLIESSPGEFELVYPSLSIKAEPPVAVVPGNADRHNARKIAEDYLRHLYSPEGQRIIAKNYFRPNDPASADPEDLKRFQPVDMVAIDDPLFGGWTAAQKKHFDANGLFDQIYQPANKP
jgi:hypothetical protein